MSDDTPTTPPVTEQDPSEGSDRAEQAGAGGRLRTFGLGLLVVSLAVITLAFVLENAVAA